MVGQQQRQAQRSRCRDRDLATGAQAEIQRRHACSGARGETEPVALHRFMGAAWGYEREFGMRKSGVMTPGAEYACRDSSDSPERLMPRCEGIFWRCEIHVRRNRAI
jgi:hypothetical protein